LALDEQKKYWVGFNLVKGIGSARMRVLLQAFENAENAWKASTTDLENAGLSARLIENISLLRAKDTLEQTWANIRDNDIQVLTWEDEE